MNKIYISIIFYIILVYLNKSYNKLYPTLPIYPYNNYEIQTVKNYILKRNDQDIALFYLTNKSVIHAFLPYIENENINYLYYLTRKQNYIIFFFKYLINRIRPWQLDLSISPININTSQTPSYPAGHAYQACIIANYLSKKYPEKKSLFEKIALACDDCRIKAGLHYPSDGAFSRKLFKLFNNSVIYI